MPHVLFTNLNPKDLEYTEGYLNTKDAGKDKNYLESVMTKDKSMQSVQGTNNEVGET